jgi:AbrB family looped-hinge helix DNA binding protein
MTLLTDEPVEIATYATRIRPRGQITIPQPIRNELLLNTGDLITFTKIGDVTILTNQQSHLSELVDRMMADMNMAGLTLTDMLEGLEEERQALWQEKQGRSV